MYHIPDDHKKTNKDQIHKCCLKSSKSVFICSQITYITHYIFWRPPVTINWIYLFFRLCLSSVITSEIVGIKCLIVCIGDNFCCSEGKSIQKGDWLGDYYKEYKKWSNEFYFKILINVGTIYVVGSMYSQYEWHYHFISNMNSSYLLR